jgi:ribonuclease P protein component
VVYAPADQGSPPRVAYAIGRAVGGAVVRNRLRRRLRTAVGAATPAPGAYLIVASPAAADLEFEALQATVTDAVRSVSTPVTI